MKRLRPGGMPGFTIVWAGHVVSLLGANMTRFAITIWAWQATGQATTLALVGPFSFGPAVLLSPIAGALVDRWNRKLVMMLSDLGAGLATIAGGLGLTGYLRPLVREVEARLPDHAAAAPTPIGP